MDFAATVSQIMFPLLANVFLIHFHLFKLYSFLKAYLTVTISCVSSPILLGRMNRSLLGRLILFCCSCCSVAKLCLALCNPINCMTPISHVLHYLPKFAQTHVHWVGYSSDLLNLCHPLLLLPSIFSRIRVFFNALALCIRWPKC